MGLWDRFRRSLSGFYDSAWFECVSYAYALNPLLLALQLWNIFDKHSSAGLSAPMFFGFILINALASVVAVKANTVAVFVSSVFSVILCIAIVITMIFI